MNENAKKIVIDLLVDSDTKEQQKPTAIASKRPLDVTVETCGGPRPKKLMPPSATCATSESATSDPIQEKPSQQLQLEAPIKLFATSQDKRERAAHGTDRSHWSWSQCQTLREMLRIDSRDISIDWLVIANYIIDFDFLLDLIPELLSVKRIVVFYGVADSDPKGWKHACSPENCVDFVCLRPSDPANSANNPLPHSILYSVHHSKLFLAGYSDTTCRVVIHTANLRYGDIHCKAQAAYIHDFLLKPTDPATGTAPSSSAFEDTLVTYVDSYRYRKPQRWQALPSGPSETLTECLRRYDFSTAQAVLIPSVPGHHKLDAAETFGHWKLRKSIAQHTTTPSPSAGRNSCPIVCQFSSMGSLSERFLRDLQVSMDTRLSRIRDASLQSNMPMRLQLVYPTVSEIRDSVEGYRGGGSVPGSLKNVRKLFLRPLYRKWSSANSTTSTTSSPAAVTNHNPLCKPNHVPHIKTYYQVSSTGDSMDWLVLTSHNLSKAAWGEVQNSNRYGGRRLFVRHWELGVMVSPCTLHVDRLVHWTTPTTSTTTTKASSSVQPSTTSNTNNDEDNNNNTTTATVPMPYKLYLPEPYQPSDEPWAVDVMYGQPDRYGRHSANDPL